MEEDKISVEEFEDLFGNTPFENIKKIRKYINENYIPKSKVKEEYVNKKELKRIIDKNMYLEMMKDLNSILED